MKEKNSGNRLSELIYIIKHREKMDRLQKEAAMFRCLNITNYNIVRARLLFSQDYPQAPLPSRQAFYR